MRYARDSSACVCVDMYEIVQSVKNSLAKLNTPLNKKTVIPFHLSCASLILKYVLVLFLCCSLKRTQRMIRKTSPHADFHRRSHLTLASRNACK